MPGLSCHARGGVRRGARRSARKHAVGIGVSDTSRGCVRSALAVDPRFVTNRRSNAARRARTGAGIDAKAETSSGGASGGTTRKRRSSRKERCSGESAQDHLASHSDLLVGWLCTGGKARAQRRLRHLTQSSCCSAEPRLGGGGPTEFVMFHPHREAPLRRRGNRVTDLGGVGRSAASITPGDQIAVRLLLAILEVGAEIGECKTHTADLVENFFKLGLVE